MATGCALQRDLSHLQGSPPSFVCVFCLFVSVVFLFFLCSLGFLRFLGVFVCLFLLFVKPVFFSMNAWDRSFIIALIGKIGQSQNEAFGPCAKFRGELFS